MVGKYKVINVGGFSSAVKQMAVEFSAEKPIFVSGCCYLRPLVHWHIYSRTLYPAVRVPASGSAVDFAGRGGGYL